MSAELLPCPWCNSNEVYVSAQLKHAHGACPECGVKGPTVPFADRATVDDRAIAAWNTRSAPKWTCDLPTVAGRYWVKWKSGDVEILEVVEYPGGPAILQGRATVLLAMYKGLCQWSGPLVPPGEGK